MRRDALFQSCLFLLTLVGAVSTLGGFSDDPKPSAKYITGSYSINPTPNNSDTNSTVRQPLQEIATQALLTDSTSTHYSKASAVMVDANSGKILLSVGIVDPRLLAQCTTSRCLTRLHTIAQTDSWEPGSVMKTLTLAAALDRGNITTSDSFYDRGVTTAGGRSILNVFHDLPSQVTVPDILINSLNTGAVHLLRSFDSDSLSLKSRDIWHDYLTSRYHFGDGIGYVPNPEKGPDLEYRYATTSFGIGITVSPLQLASAYAAVVNGGIYYAPYTHPKEQAATPSRSLKESTSVQMQTLLQQALTINNPAALHSGYRLGGKSGTAPIAQNDGTYMTGIDSGSYIGYIEHGDKKYVLLIRIDNPQVTEIASHHTARVWASTVQKMIKQQQL